MRCIFFAKCCVVSMVSFHILFYIMQSLLLQVFQKRIETKHLLKIKGKNSIFIRFGGLILFWLLKSKVFVPVFQTRHQMKPLPLHIIVQKLHINISTGINFIGDHTYLGKYCEFQVYDMTRNWLMEHLVHYCRSWLG